MEGEAWSLATDADDIVYLQHESDVLIDGEDDKTSPFSFNNGFHSGDVPKGFDFSGAQQMPTLTVFGSPTEPGDEASGMAYSRT